MADPLYELLHPTVSADIEPDSTKSLLTSAYTSRLSTLSVSALTSTEPEALNHDAQSLLRTLQALAKRSYKSINISANAVASIRDSLPDLSSGSEHLRTSLPTLESKAIDFSQKYAKPTENPVLDRRRRAMRLNENVDRISDVLDLPALLQSTIAASTGSSSTSGGQASTSANASYASALDLYAHIKRLQKLYPLSDLINSIAEQAEEAMQGMTTKLISTLKSQNLKLAWAMRLTGLLRRVAPELEAGQPVAGSSWTSTANEGSMGTMFLVCRLANLMAILEALEPLRELADQESAKVTKSPVDERNAWAAGQQTERYLKRYIEVFREQCFSIVSMFKSVFPTSLQGPSAHDKAADDGLVANLKPATVSALKEPLSEDSLPDDPLQRLPSALSTFCFELVDILTDTLRMYMPNIRDRSSRDSLLTQVLYLSGSLGRLGGDFGMMLALLQEELEDTNDASPNTGEAPVEWIEIMKKHRIQAGRLELLASGVGGSKLTTSGGRETLAPA